MNNVTTLKPIIILGTGGHAKVVADALIQSGNEILGFITKEAIAEQSFLGYKILGDDETIKNYPPTEVVLANGVGALPYQNLRWELSADMRSKGYVFETVIHPSAIVADDVKLAEGVQLLANTVIQPGTRIGRDCIINTGTILDHDCSVEQNCHIAPAVVCSGGVHVGEGTHLGTGTIIIENIDIGKKSVVAAGSVVYRNVPNNITFIQKRETRLDVNER